MVDVPLVSVVIPVYNRAPVLPRALRSVLGQSVRDLEVLVVDDGSDDDPAAVIDALGDARARLLRHPERRNAAAARNTGARAARGRYLAFLDSDDEWLPDHLQRRIDLMRSSGAEGSFGSFWVEAAGRRTERRCRDLPPGKRLGEYILSPLGDVRTSTLVFETAAFLEVLFDDGLAKNQDWDLALRFAKRHRFVVGAEPTAVLHVDGGDRMSARRNHAGSAAFLARHRANLGRRNLGYLLSRHAVFTLELEGRNEMFYRYTRELRELGLSGGLRPLLLGYLLPMPLSRRVLALLRGVARPAPRGRMPADPGS